MSEKMTNGSEPKILLDIKGLKTYFYTEDGVVQAVNGVDFAIRAGQVMGLVGESGCGKSVTSLSIMRLLGGSGKIVEGEVWLGDRNLVTLPEGEMVKLRGGEMSMIFQQPTSCLNPIFRVGDQVAEVLIQHQGVSKEQAWDRAVEMLARVGIPDAGRRAKSFPHEISGGQAQRVMIAMAFACQPELLIADEPTTALDVTIQAQILDLMRRMQSELGTTILLITHDLGVIAEMADHVAVMYAGLIVEYTDVHTLFENPMHPYSEGLMAAIPVLGEVRDSLAVIPGTVPDLINLPPGCKFSPRCPYVQAICTQQDPPLIEVKPGHKTRCWIHNPETSEQWTGYTKTDWRFVGEEVFVLKTPASTGGRNGS
ncbi:MAG: ABC transporter ATP-binding protein [Caldilineaceae bacterium]|nr:ABC transporter ATP-binding protein [Caldilineaceae bacterium]MBP8107603.1 ABC transporter ATP-binding protein [Caldilineaceae bacterium]MBP8124087.1 ABC transporter ATP-binding protein [Caldilineaceae bacterium]MBP9072484.1 ABC transporter ATP-binding protein [Caldilineaceae bacterium]